MPYRMNQQAYSETFGPTTGDVVHLGDTGLTLELKKIIRSTAMSVNLWW